MSAEPARLFASNVVPGGFVAGRDLAEGITGAALYPTGFADLDAMTNGGLRAGQLSVIGAATGVGKSSFAEQIALKMATGIDGAKVLYLPFEMGIVDTERRMLAKILRVSIHDYARMTNSGIEGDWDALRLAGASYGAKGIRFWTPVYGQESCTVEDVIRECGLCAGDGWRPSVVIIDHCRHIEGWLDGSKSAHLGPTRIVQALRAFAEESGIHVMLICQLNRLSYGQKPTLAHLQDTSALEQCAYTVLLLHRPFRGMKGKDVVAEVRVAKNRNGPEGKFHVHYTGSTMSFHSMTLEEQERVECCP